LPYTRSTEEDRVMSEILSKISEAIIEGNIDPGSALF